MYNAPMHNIIGPTCTFFVAHVQSSLLTITRAHTHTHTHTPMHTYTIMFTRAMSMNTKAYKMYFLSVCTVCTVQTCDVR